MTYQAPKLVEVRDAVDTIQSSGKSTDMFDNVPPIEGTVSGYESDE